MLIKETIEIDLSDDPNNPKIIRLGNLLTKNEIWEFISILKEKQEIFTWSYADMPKLDPNLVVHNLGIK